MAVIALVSLLAAAVSLQSPDSGANAAVNASIAACEQWLLEPKTWADSVAAFPSASGLSNRIVAVESVPKAALPPVSFRRALHHWRAPIREGGIFISASDQVPMCHLAGGGPMDLQPSVEAVLGSVLFLKHWTRIATDASNGMLSSRYVSKQDTKLTIQISRATSAGARTDRVQFIATAQYDIGK